MGPFPRRKDVDRNNLIRFLAGSIKGRIIADPEVPPKPMDDALHASNGFLKTWFGSHIPAPCSIKLH
jgi:hypothetical protein